MQTFWFRENRLWFDYALLLCCGLYSTSTHGDHIIPPLRTILVEYALATPPTRSPPSPPHGGTPVALIAGVSVGVAVLLLVVLFAILTRVARPRPQQAQRPPAERQPLLVDESELQFIVHCSIYWLRK